MLDEKPIFLIVGGDSFIGSFLRDSYLNRVYDIYTTTRNVDQITAKNLYLDLKDGVSSFFSLNKIRFNVAIICSAVTSFQKCENNPAESELINVTATFNLIEELRRRCVFIISLSSTAVFDGNKSFYKTTDKVSPNTVYGRQKAELEYRLRGFDDSVAILRVSKIINNDTPLFVRWILELKAKHKINPFYDMYFSPVYIDFMLVVIANLLKKKVGGIQHLSASNDISYADAAKYIANKIHADEDLIDPLSYRDMKLISSPKHTTFDCAGLGDIGLYPPLPIDALDKFLLNKL